LGRIWPPSWGPNPPASLTGWRPSRGQLRRPVRDANSERVPRPWRDGFASLTGQTRQGCARNTRSRPSPRRGGVELRLSASPALLPSPLRGVEDAYPPPQGGGRRPSRGQPVREALGIVRPPPQGGGGQFRHKRSVISYLITL
jgi:hypothetical protein